MTYNIPYPRLLGASGEERRIYTPFASVNLNITPLSTATMQLTDDDSIPARSYVEMFTSSGSAGVFRTRSPQKGYAGESTMVEMEHAACEIGDYLVKAEIEAEKTASEAMTQIFGYYGGSKWQLGTVASSDTVAVQVDYDNVLEAMLGIMEQIPAYMLAFDFTTSPWTVSVAQRPATVSAEGRLSRNIASVHITEDDSELCTRAYAKGLGTGGGYGYIDADTISTYGIVERVASNDDLNATQAARVANLYIEKHKHPRLTIQIDAQDLAQITGETLDALAIGKKYRLAMPDYNVTKEETITNLQYADVYGDPGFVAVTLSEEEDTATKFLHKTSAGGGRAAKELHSRLLQDEYLIGIEVVDDVRTLTPARVIASINDNTSNVYISGDEIELDGQVFSQILNNGQLNANQISASQIETVSLDVGGVIDNYTGSIRTGGVTIGGGGYLTINGPGYGATFTMHGQAVSWQSKEIVTAVGVTMTAVSRSASQYFLYSSTSGGTTAAGTVSGRLVTGYTAGSVNPTTETIYYLGRAASA